MDAQLLPQLAPIEEFDPTGTDFVLNFALSGTIVISLNWLSVQHY